MGNRATIAIQQDETPNSEFVILYGHWAGDYALQAAQNVLDKTDRIGDPTYLTAQLFWEFATLGDYSGELGYGIYTGDKEAAETDDNPPVFVNPYTGEITHNGNTIREGKKIVRY